MPSAPLSHPSHQNHPYHSGSHPYHRRLALLALAALLALGGCQRGGDPPAPAGDPEARALVDAAGDRALLTLVVRPTGVDALSAQLEPLRAALPPDLRGALDEADPIATLRRLTADLPGWDRSRPVIAALLEPPLTAPPGALTPQLPAAALAPTPPPAMRHRLLIPATDPAQLAAALAARLPAWRPAGEGFTRDETTHARLFPEDGRLRVEVSTGGAPPSDWSVPGGASARTPALAAATADGPAVALLLRPWHLRAVFTVHGASQVAQALAHVSPDLAASLAAQGAAILLAGEALMTGEGAEFDDWAATVAPGAGGLDLRLVATLTPDGAAAFARRGSHPSLTVGEGAVAHVALSGDLRAMIDAARAPAVLADARRPGDVARAFAECGLGCPMHAAARRPLGTLKTLAALAAGRTPLATAEVRAPQVAFFGVGAEGPKLAVAFQAPAGADLGPLRALVADAGRSGPRVELWSDPLPGGAQKVVVGVGLDPRVAFGAPAADAPLGRLSLRPAALDAPLPAPAAAIARRIGGLDGRLDHADRALVAQIRLRLDQPPTAIALAPAMAAVHASPIGLDPARPATACVARAARGLSQALEALAAAPMEARTRLGQAALAELEPDLACAAADPALAEAARGMRRMAALATTADALRGWDPAPAIAQLEPLCAAGDAVVCAALTTARARPRVALPAIDARDCADRPAHGPRLVVVGERILLDGAPLPSDPAQRLDALRTAAVAGRIQVGAEGATPWARMAPLIDALRQAGATGLHVAARDGERVVRPAVMLRAAEGVEAPAEAGDGRFAALLKAPPSAEPAPAVTVALGVDAARIEGAEAITPDRLRALYPEGPIALRPAPDVPWRRVVELVGAGCPEVVLSTESAPAPAPMDAPEAPETLEVVEPPDARGARERAAIQATIRRYTAPVRRCYEEGLRLSPKLAGTITVRMVISPTGEVDEARASRDDLGDPEVTRCVLRAVRTMRFPAAKGITRVSYPFVFQAQ